MMSKFDSSCLLNKLFAIDGCVIHSSELTLRSEMSALSSLLNLLLNAFEFLNEVYFLFLIKSKLSFKFILDFIILFSLIFTYLF